MIPNPVGSVIYLDADYILKPGGNELLNIELLNI